MAKHSKEDYELLDKRLITKVSSSETFNDANCIYATKE